MNIITIKKFITRWTPVLALIIPKKKDLWVYGCWDGKLYADNSKYLYEYMNQKHPEVESVWLTRSGAILQELTNKGLKCYKRFSVKGIMTALRAEAAFITSDEINDISPFMNRNKTMVIQLWHGFAGKAARWKDDKGAVLFSERELKRFSAYYWTASSEKYIDVMNEATSAPKDRFVITGYPRNDTFVLKPRNTYIEQLREKYKDHKFIIYMPTHRNFGQETIRISDFKWVDDWLRENSIVMVYKPHYHELQNVIHLESDFTNIILAKEQSIWGDVYSYIHYFDLLISDYSSIAYDFLCAKKPIVLFTYDIEHFRNSDAGLWDFYETSPVGPFCYTWKEVLEQVKKLLEDDVWFDKREKCRMLFHPFDDGKNSERVYNAVRECFLK